MASAPPPNTRGAHSVGDGGGGGKRPGWLVPLLALLALIIAAAILLPLVLGGDDDEAQVAAPAQQEQAPSITEPPDAVADPDAAVDDPNADPALDADAPDGDAGAGELTAGGQTVVPLPSGGLADLVGEEASGEVLVQEVVAEEGFFVGPEGSQLGDWLFVEFGGDTGVNEQGSIPAAGDRVRISGPVEEPTPGLANQLGLNEQQEQALLDTGAYVNAELVEPAGA